MEIAFEGLQNGEASSATRHYPAHRIVEYAIQHFILQLNERRLTMKKSIWMLGLGVVSLFIFGFNVHAQSNEVSEPITTTYYVTGKALPLDEGRVFMNYEAIGVTVNERGEGLFHNATARSLGGMLIEKGIYKDERGWGVWNLQNGEKVFFTYTWAGEIKAGVGIGKGTVTLTGGTGKCAGIQGSFEATRYSPRSAVEGIGQSYTKANIKYKLP